MTLSTLFFSPISAEIYTGTSLTYGVSNYGSHTRVDQYIGDSNYPWVYGKIGIARETLDYQEVFHGAESWADGILPWGENSIDSFILGVGFNLLEYKGFFIDASADYYYAFSYDDRTGDTYSSMTPNGFHRTDEILKEENFSSGAVELGIGYSFSSFSFRGDAVYLLSTPTFQTQASFYRESDSGVSIHPPVTHELDNRLYLGFGITYWW